MKDEWPTACFESFSFYLGYFGIKNSLVYGAMYIPGPKSQFERTYIAYSLCKDTNRPAGTILYLVRTVPHSAQNGLELA